MIVIKVLRANSLGDYHPPKLTIEIHKQLGENDSLDDWSELSSMQGRKLADALFGSLPGGTMDQLLSELLRRRASLFTVPFETRSPALGDSEEDLISE